MAPIPFLVSHLGVFLPLVLLAFAGTTVGLPAEAPRSGLSALAQDGEVLLLPKHGRSSFSGHIVSQTAESCEAVEEQMFDLPSYSKRFASVGAVKILSRSERKIAYEFQLKVAFAPSVRGSVEKLRPGKLRFTDGETPAYSEMDLQPDGTGGCLLVYQSVEAPGQSSGWVKIIKGLEATSGDAGNFAVALITSRGFSQKRRPFGTAADAEAAFSALAGHGTAVKIDRRGKIPVYTLRRRVTAPPGDIIRVLRDRAGYDARSVVVKKSKVEDATSAYSIGGFGGRVDFTTRFRQEGSPAQEWTAHESVTGGDLRAGVGGWTWRVRAMDGGSDVELVWALDPVPGSMILSTMSRTDPICQESFVLYVALSLMGDLVDGRPLGARSALTAER